MTNWSIIYIADWHYSSFSRFCLILYSKCFHTHTNFMKILNFLFSCFFSGTSIVSFNDLKLHSNSYLISFNCHIIAFLRSSIPTSLEIITFIFIYCICTILYKLFSYWHVFTVSAQVIFTYIYCVCTSHSHI